MNKTNKWLAIGLGVSLIINLFVAGIIIGAHYKDRPHHDARGSGLHTSRVDFNLRQVSKHLDKKQRKELRNYFRENRADLKARWEQVRASEEVIRALVMAQEIDSEALREALENHQSALGHLHAPAEKILIDIIPTLEYDKRQQIAKSLFRRKKHKDRDRKAKAPNNEPAAEQNEKQERGT